MTAQLDEQISKAVKNKISLEVIHELLYPQYRKPKKQRVTQPKHRLGLSIEERPESIDDRSEYGHWEIDTVLLTKEKGECLLTLTERKTRLEIIRLIPQSGLKTA